MEFITEWPPPDGPDRIQIDQEEEQPKNKRVKRRKSSGRSIEELVSAQVLIASWWRKNGTSQDLNNVKSKAPYAKIKAICKLKDTQNFLQALEKRFVDSTTCRDIYTLVTLYRILEKDQEAFSSSQLLLEKRALRYLSCKSSESLLNLEYIKGLSSFDKEVLRVATLAQLQYHFACSADTAAKAEMAATSSLPKEDFPTSTVQVCQAKELTLQNFKEKFSQAKKPVIIEGLELTQHLWTFSFLKSVAGQYSVHLRYAHPDSTEWAKLESSAESVTIRDFIESIEEDKVGESEAKGYLFDWSLPLYCPELYKDFSVPFYFEESQDYLKKVDCSLYKRSWPSLFISPKGTVSELHIDAFGSNFWMALLSGRKKWTFFQPKMTPYLRPRYVDTFDPVFDIDWQELKVDQFTPTVMMEVTLTPGQVLFVPAGSPHRVENLEASVAVSGNIVDESNLQECLLMLSRNALSDNRCIELMAQLLALQNK